MTEKSKATQNKAEDVETPKQKRIDIPIMAKAEISRMSQNLDRYINGVAAGLGIEGNWQFDMRKMQIIVEDTKCPQI